MLDLHTDVAREIQPPPEGNGVLAMAFSPDARWLATGGSDGHVRVWQVRTGTQVTALKAAGVHLYRVMLPAFMAAAVVCIFMLLFNNYVLPESNHRLAALTSDIGRKRPTVTIEPGRFVTALAVDDWGEARWVAYEDMPEREKLVPGVHGLLDPKLQPKLKSPVVPLLRHSFAVRGPVAQALLFVSGLGHYEAYLNGAKVGDRFLAQAASWGAISYEQDWLVEIWLGVRGLRERPGRVRGELVARVLRRGLRHHVFVRHPPVAADRVPLLRAVGQQGLHVPVVQRVRRDGRLVVVLHSNRGGLPIGGAQLLVHPSGLGQTLLGIVFDDGHVGSLHLQVPHQRTIRKACIVQVAAAFPA